MQNVGMFIFGLLMVYIAWWLIRAIRDRVAFEVEMGLGVGSLWAAGFEPVLFKDLPKLISGPPVILWTGWVLIGFSISMFVIAMLSLHRSGKPTTGWENTTELTGSGIHGLVRHPMQLSGIVGACGVILVNPTLPVLVLGAVSATCFALGVQAEDRFDIAKFGEPYRTYMKQVPALNLPAGIWARLQAQTGQLENM
ncbi:MAG: isoprenylcysteine carboxylmethyltransferase family protein [Anaerolineae bacterium]|nr:isoprenylcysteine carboxylmethyltransferase family protein [Anaerolineae bacterium]